METENLKAAANNAFMALFTDYSEDGVRKYIAEDIIQHNPFVPTGRDALIGFLPALKASGIGPGAPATPERVESGLVSVGGDTDDETNPFEVRLEKYVDLHVPDDTVGIQSLRRIKAQGIRRHQLGIVLEGHTPAPLGVRREDVMLNGARIGMLTNCVWSYRMKANIGFVLIDSAVPAGSEVEVARAGGAARGKLVAIPFL